MTVLVTGAAGRVGANMVKRLVDSGRDVTAMVMPGDLQAGKLASLPAVRVVEADLRDQSAIDRACKGVTEVVHLAAQLVRGKTSVDEFYDVNALGTLRVLEGARGSGAGLRRFVLVSTDGTYRPGDPPAVPLTEEVPQRPADYYGTSKLLGEVILRNHAEQFDIPFTIARFATVVSPEEAPLLFRLRRCRQLLSRAKLGKDTNIWQLFQGRPDLLPTLEEGVGLANEETAIALVGPGEKPWTLHMIDVRDAVDGLYLALTEPAAVGQAFNLAAAEPTSHSEGAAVISEVFDVPKITVRMPLTWRLELSIDRARSVLGFEPRYDYRAMVEASRHLGRSSGTEFIPARI